MFQMSGQKYRRTNFDDDDNTSTGGTPPGVIYDPAIAFKVGASFWQKRSCLERILFPVIVILSLAVVILASLLAAKHSQLKHKEELCTSPVCVTVASTIINAIDETVDPCDDFYQYACGGWMKKHPIPNGQSRWGTFDVMWRQNQVILKNVLEQPPEHAKSKAEHKAMLYYQSCMDKNKTIEKLGASPLITLIRELGGWNMTSHAGAWDGANWKLRDTLERLHGLVIYVLFQTWVGADDKDTSKNILQVDQPDLILVRDQYINKSIEDDKILTAYLKYMGDFGELLGADRNATREDMIKVIEFEAKLANITTPNEERRDDMKTYHKKTIADLQEMVPVINWLRYFNQLLSITTYSVDTDENIIVLAPEYFVQMNDLIKEHLSTPEGRLILHNYMIWQLVADLAPYLSEPFREAKKAFNKVLMGASGYSEEQWRYCAANTDNIVGFALGAMFVREVFSDSKDKAEMMIEEIKTAFKNNLPHLSWMDEETRKAAKEKANAVIDMIGFPPYILNSTELDKRYMGLDISPNEYFENNIRNLHFNLKRNLDKLRKPPNKFSWNMTPPTVNAYYVPTKNEIVFPAGVLQAPFYDYRYPKSLNFGGIGVVMGHELTHGFDDVGREYDKNGVLRPWWNKTVIEKFKNQTKCMVKQYSSYTINDEHIRGKQTLGENIADNGGLKAAYLAYEDWVRRHGEERALPGTTLNHYQLFFVSFAQVWCSNSLPQTDHLAILTDEHSPAKYRVIGTLSNSNEFSKLFKCKRGSKMNPKDKCEVW